MSTIIFADLDGSLLERPEDRQRGPLCIMTEAQSTLLNALWDMGAVVPTTGQSSKEYEALRLPFSNRAILAHGVTIREIWGDPEPRWHGIMSEAAQKHSGEVESITSFLNSLSDPRLRVRVFDDCGIRYRIAINSMDESGQHLHDIESQLQPELPEGWRLGRYQSRNGRFINRIGLLAPFVGKARAVSWYLENLAPQRKLVIGVGDAFTDLSFLGVCHFVLMPSDSELFTALKAAKALSR